MSDIPEERTYYLRIILMYMDLTKETILKVFKYLIKSEDVANFLASVETKSKLHDLLKNNILNKTEYNLVSYRPNPERFDIALLIRLIFGLCKNEIARPHLGWTTKPHPKDESLGADLIRLRDVRNMLIGHRIDAKLSETEYEKIRDKLRAILVRVIEHIEPRSKGEVERRINDYTKLTVDTDNTRVKLYFDQLLEYQNEVQKLQKEVEELIKKSQEFQEYFHQAPEFYVRYIKLLFDGGRLVLCGILERELDNHGDNLASLLYNNREVLLSNIDTQYVSCIFPTEPSNVDHTGWDVGLLASIILLVFTDMNEDDSSNIEIIKTARLYYADHALSSLDPSEFMAVWADLISSLKHLSLNISGEKKLEVESLINCYKKKSEDGDADEYLDQLRRSGVPVKTLKDKHKETVYRLRQILTELSNRGMKLMKEHVLEIKILTTCHNEETKKNAEDFLERNLQASFNDSDLPSNLIRTETDKIVASINTHPDVKPAGVKRSCILLSIKSSSPSGLIHILDYCASHHFKARLHNISNELHYLYEDAFLLQGHVTLESLSEVIENVDNTEDESYQGLSIPLKCSSVDGMRYVLNTLKNEKTTNGLNFIAEMISVELKETVWINIAPDLFEFRDVLDETDSEGSSSDGTDVDEADRADDIYPIKMEWKNQKLDGNRKALDHSPAICIDETEESACGQEYDSALLREGSGSGSGDIYADKAEDRHSPEKEWENQKPGANRKKAEQFSFIRTDELEESTYVHEDDLTFDLGCAESGRSSPEEADEEEITKENPLYPQTSQRKPDDDENHKEKVFSPEVLVDQKKLNELWAKTKENEKERTKVFEICKNICSYIMNKHLDKVLHVWPAYESHDNSSIVFVLITKDFINETELGLEYSTVVRPLKTYSDEATVVMRSKENNEHRLSFKESEDIRQAINNKAKELMRCHKYLSVISGSGVRSKNFKQGESEIIQEACIVLFVHTKGKIPLDETEFPKCLDGIPVDVREGEFQTCASAKKYQDKLQMGCQIESGKTGTLGGFMDHPKYGISAITCAHVVLDDEELHNLRRDSRKVWRCNEKPVYQPDSRNTFRNYCGQVKEAIYKQGTGDNSGVDLAIFKIEDRAPDSGAFPDVNNIPTDMVFETGKLCFSVNENFGSVTKFGCETDKTQGVVQFTNSAVKLIDYDHKYKYGSVNYTYTLFNQFEIRPTENQPTFVQRGDSGALVFQTDATGDLLCVGMVVGGIEPFGNGIVIPISAIKSELGVSEFKNFSWSVIRRMDSRLANIEEKLERLLRR